MRMTAPSARAIAIFVRERFQPVIAIPVAGVLALAALGPSSPVAIVRAVVASVSLLLAVRIADDMSDLQVDRIRAPERALPAGRIDPTDLVGWIPLLLLLGCAASGSELSIGVIALGAAALVAFYRAKDRVSPWLRPPVSSIAFLLVPVIVALGAGSEVGVAVRVGAFALTGAVAHDYAHDADRFSRPRGAAAIALAGYALCAGQGVALALVSPDATFVLAALAASLVPTAALLARLIREPVARNAQALRIPGFLPVALPLLVRAVGIAAGGGA
jgi:4-hydroxybenzoate polyprenyltransferase